MKKWWFVVGAVFLFICGGMLFRFMAFGSVFAWNNPYGYHHPMMGYYNWSDTTSGNEEMVLIVPTVDDVRLDEVSVHVTLIDADQTVVYDADVTTSQNGWVALFVEDDFQGNIIVSYGDLTGSLEVGSSFFPCGGSSYLIDLQ